MLKITIPGACFYNETTEEFVYTDDTTITLEHFLLSISKWEAKWEKPFIGTKDKTPEECADYVRCMTLEENVDPSVYRSIPANVFEKINEYIELPMTATTIRESPGSRANREIIYHWMTSLGISFECEKWNLNRLIMLVRVCLIKNGPQKKMSRKEIFSQNRALNEERKKQLRTRG